jgi:hypothetical protein
MALKVAFQDQSGLPLPESYHRVQRINLDPANAMATIEVFVHPNAEARRKSGPNRALRTLSFTVRDLEPVPEYDEVQAQMVKRAAPQHFTEWFSPEALDKAGRNVYAQAYKYLQAKVDAYKSAQEA